jgi:heme o synthase
MYQLHKRMIHLRTKFRAYWPLVKSLQTGLLVSTGLGGYMSARCPIHDWATLTGLLISLVASISGSTILNMWWDRDIDAKMPRTLNRPLASGQIRPGEALWIGLRSHCSA